MRLLNLDSPVMQALGKLADLFLLNVLFIICSLPVITVGASLTALYTVTLKAAKNEENYITISFFRAFRRNFKISTLAWLLVLTVGIVLFIDLRLLSSSTLSYRAVFQAGTIAIFLLYCTVSIYLFPYIARFEDTLRTSVKNAAILAVSHLPFTLLFLSLGVLAVVLTLTTDIRIIGFIWIVIGFSGLSYLGSLFFRRIFARIEK